MNFFKKFRDTVICIVLAALPFFFLNSNLKSPERIHALDRILLKISAPIQYVASLAADGVSNVWQEYIYLVDVQQDNNRLAWKNRLLKQQLGELQSSARENGRLRALLDLKNRTQIDSLSGLVISKELSPYFRVMRIRLDRGEDDRVRPGMPVLSSHGLVGQVRRVSAEYSDVLLTVDRHSAVDVVVQRTGTRGFLRGTGAKNRYVCRLTYSNDTQAVRKGDKIYTTGQGKKFPEGILVGTVSFVSKKPYGLDQQAEVQPAVDFSNLEDVLILLGGSRLQDTLDKKPGS